MKDKILIGVLVAVLLLSTTAVMATQAIQEISVNNGGGGGGNGTAPIEIFFVDPAYIMTSAQSWNNSSQGFTFYYIADTEPYNCSLLLDGNYVSNSVSLNNNTQQTLYSNTSIDDGWHTWQIYCENASSSTILTSERYIAIDNVVPTVELNWPANDSYIHGGAVQIAVTGNGTGSPPDTFEISATDGQFTGPGTCEYAVGYGADTATCTWDLDISNVTTDTVIYLNITMNDSAGNEGSPAYYQLTVDNTAPEMTISADKTTVNNAGNNPNTPSPPINITTNASDNHFMSQIVFIYDVANNATTYIMPITQTAGIYSNLWDTKYYTMDGAAVMSLDANDHIAVAGYFTQNATTPEAQTYAFFNKSDGKFVAVAYPGGSAETLYDNVSTFEPVYYAGVGGSGEFKRTGKILTAKSVSGEWALTNSAGTVIQPASTFSPAGAYTIYGLAQDQAGNGKLVSIGATINNNPPTQACTSCGGGGSGGGGSPIIKPGESQTVDIDTGRSFVFSTDGTNTHTIRVTGINGNSADITVMSDPIKVTMNINDVKDIDWNNNGKDDLELTLLSINGTIAKVKVKALVETAPVAQQEASQTEQTGVKVEGKEASKTTDLASGSLTDASGKGNLKFFAVLIAIALLTWACTSWLFKRKKPEESSVN